MDARGSSVVLIDPGNFTPDYVQSLGCALAELGLRVRVITSPPLFESIDAPDRCDREWLFFRWQSGRIGSFLRHRRRLRQILKAVSYPHGLWRTWRSLRRIPAGVLHVQWALFPPLDGLLVRALRARGWRIVYTAHDRFPGRGTAHRRYRAFLPLVDLLIVHTVELARQVVATYPEAAGRVHVIAHGGSAPGRPAEADRRSARRAFGLEGDAQVLLFFGMIKPYKGLEYLLEAMPLVLAAFPKARLVVAGEPLMPLAAIVDRIERLGLGPFVVFRPSFVPRNEVHHYFAAADLVVAPHIEVAASGVVVMAQGYGLPVVSSRVGGLPEFIEPESRGFVVRPRSAESLAEAICRALADPDALIDMGRRAWLAVGRENRWTDVSRRTLDIYDLAVRSTRR